MNSTIFENSVVFITGADGGIGKAFISELLNRKVKKIYATGLDINKLQDVCLMNKNIVIPVRLDVTDSDEIKECVEKCNDITILINNAGIELKAGFLEDKSAQKAKYEMNVNFIGAMDLSNQFLSTLRLNHNPAIINILSIASLVLIKNISTYCASKLALHLYTQAIREELKNEIKVIGIYPGYVDTSMVSDIDIEKISPLELVKNICNEIELNKLDVFPDKMSKKYERSTKIQIEYLL